MPRKSKADILENRLIEDLERMAFDPEVPAYVRHRCKATLATMIGRRDKKLALKKKIAAAKKAAQPVVYHSVLPENHRGPVTPVAASPVVLSSEWLPRPGESAAQTRARLEMMAAKAD